MATTVRLFDPTAPRREPEGNQAQMPQIPLKLSGAVVGFIDNAKPNFHYLVDDLAELLVHTYGVRHVIRRRKPSASIPATAEIVAELAATCDMVIAGSGD
jgi:hypothetical protein